MSTRPPAGDDWIALAEGELPSQAAGEWVVVPGCGAVVTFHGTVRDHSSAGLGVTALEYEAWQPQAEAAMAIVVAEARANEPSLGRIVVIHRVGRVDLGQPAVVVAVSAPHRGEAFEAARYLIDETKARAPIWKKEIRADGSVWVEGCPEPVVAEPVAAGPAGVGAG